MLKIIDNLPENVLAIEAGGEVTGADYKSVFIPAVDEKLKTNKKVRLLYYLGPNFTGFSPKAMLDDAEVGIKHFASWDRVALVSDHEVINAFAKLFGYLLPGEVRIFTNKHLEDAKKWIAEF